MDCKLPRKGFPSLSADHLSLDSCEFAFRKRVELSYFKHVSRDELRDLERPASFNFSDLFSLNLFDKSLSSVLISSRDLWWPVAIRVRPLRQRRFLLALEVDVLRVERLLFKS